MPDAPRTVLVTGANGGIGLATTLELARAGYDVVGTVRTDDAGATVEKAAAEAGVDVRWTLLDVDDAERCREVVDEEAPWAVVNNAGYALAGAVTDIGDGEARAQLETLVVAPARLGRLVARRLLDAGEPGRIVNVTSIAAEMSSPLLGWYVAAKKALEGLSDAMRLELAPEGIDVVLVQPGMVRTGIWDGARDQLDRAGDPQGPSGSFAALTRRVEPLMASPESVAGVIRKALDAKHPRDRYPVGLDAQLLTRVARFVPVAITDVATRTLLRLAA